VKRTRGSTVRDKSARDESHAAHVLSVPSDRALRVVVVSDTHSRPHPNAASVVTQLAPDVILHGGDIGDLDVLSPLRAIAPVYAVRGNIDEHAPEIPDSVELDLRSDDVRRLKILLIHRAVYGPKLLPDAAALARRTSASLVICGHSHVPFIGRDKGFTLFNPGSIGPKRFDLPITLGLLNVTSTGSTLKHVSCETGELWLPRRGPALR
jgi:putative phosphoesterase